MLRHAVTRQLVHFSTLTGEREEELQKTEFLENEKSFLGEIFHIFKGVLLVKCNKIANITLKNVQQS